LLSNKRLNTVNQTLVLIRLFKRRDLSRPENRGL
jgi:hypothetical protein